jgi:hypothetical protein
MRLPRAAASTNEASFQRLLFGNFVEAATGRSWPKFAGRLQLLASLASSTDAGLDVRKGNAMAIMGGVVADRGQLR